MTLTEQFRLLDKVKRVVHSCQTSKQYQIAETYCYLAAKTQLKSYICAEILGLSTISMHLGHILWKQEFEEMLGKE